MINFTTSVNVPTGAIPDWLPCYHCAKPLSAHIDSKCPFEASNFNPSDDKLIMEALYEMRRMRGGRPPHVNAQLSAFSDYQENDYRLALEIVLDRWLKDMGVT